MRHSKVSILFTFWTICGLSLLLCERKESSAGGMASIPRKIVYKKELALMQFHSRTARKISFVRKAIVIYDQLLDQKMNTNES